MEEDNGAGPLVLHSHSLDSVEFPRERKSDSLTPRHGLLADRKQTLFADNTYSKPYLVTYINTAFFIVPLIPLLLRQAYHDPRSIPTFFTTLRSRLTHYRPLSQEEDEEGDEGVLKPDSPRFTHPHPHSRPLFPHETGPNMPSPVLLQPSPETSQLLSTSAHSSVASTPSRLDLLSTARLSLEFCILWFLANYFVAACLHYTTVASSTILTSTSSVFTLLFGTLFRVESFTLRKFLGVTASLAGIALISSADLSGSSNENRGSFPHKSIREVAIGDAMALFSALLYGLYAVFMKKRIGDESRVNMPLFFGLVGLFNVLFLWPGFFILHFAEIEKFELPPDGRVAGIIVVNSASSLVSDFAWAYAVLLTSPIVVTVGLSMTIPLSLIGQMILNNQHASLIYWIGALVVVASFVVVNQEAKPGEGDTVPVAVDERDGERVDIE